MIKQLQITHLRNLTSINLLLAECNVFVGENGSGKTSLLEAVFLLSRGKTFRHHEPRRYISHYQGACTVWAKTEGGTLAIQKKLDDKNFSSTILRLNEQTANSQSLLTYTLPVLLIDPSGMSVLEEGSYARRQMLDWLVFHVKPEFYGEWLAYQKLLKHRNLLLKSPTVHQRMNELSAWDYQLAHHAHKLHEYRQEVFDLWQTRFNDMLALLLPAYQGEICLSYQAGFDKGAGLLNVLKQRTHSDIELGYTRVGAHRADVVAVFEASIGGVKMQAVDVLSRGEKKLLVAALRLSQLQVVCEYHQGQPMVLIDDIDAELDVCALDKLLATILSLPCQLMITSLQNDTVWLIERKISKLTTPKSFKVFHVKQGVVTECG